ncbi:MAG: LysR family transcriptional regulator [Pseudomonadota bacterium]
MAKPPDPQQLQQFLALLQNRSFRLTAEQLGLSQSALTKSVQRLEKQIGCRLFDRTTRTVTPTNAAMALRGKAEDALRELSAFSAEADIIAGTGAATLRVGAIALALDSVVVPALTRLASSHSELQVELAVGSTDVYEDLATGHCDVVVGDQANFELSPYAPSLRMQPLTDEPLVALFRSHHPAAAGPSTQVLLEYPWAIPSRYFAENVSLQALANQVQLGQFPQYKMTSLSACISLAARSDVVALAPLSVAQELQSDGFDHHPLAEALKVPLALFTLARVSPDSSIRAFLSAAQNAVTPSVT